MPIVFVHGVANRRYDPTYQYGWESIKRFLQEYVCPAISSDPKNVAIIPSYWGGDAATFAWNRISCPRTKLLGMGGAESSGQLEKALLMASDKEIRDASAESGALGPRTSGLLGQGPRAWANEASGLDLKRLSTDEISDLAVTVIVHLEEKDEGTRSSWIVAADAVAHDDSFHRELATKTSAQEQAELFQRYLQSRLRDTGQKGLISQGPVDRFRDRFAETLNRVDGLGGAVAARLFAQVRSPLNSKFTLFLGDVFTYLNSRGVPGAVGIIPKIVIEDLRQARDNQQEREDEPLVVLTHSMGGQIVWDLVTTFLAAENIRIDFWCATASQVALFEEMALFHRKNPGCNPNTGMKVPVPTDTLGAWWNVWDPADFLSFTGAEIFDRVRDEAYNSGLSVMDAHGGYLVRPSFYRRLAFRITESRQKGWKWA